jgi:hypothetical protein
MNLDDESLVATQPNEIPVVKTSRLNASAPLPPDPNAPLPPLPDYLVSSTGPLPSSMMPPQNTGDDVPF